jgi:hypothetical protein
MAKPNISLCPLLSSVCRNYTFKLQGSLLTVVMAEDREQLLVEVVTSPPPVHVTAVPLPQPQLPPPLATPAPALQCRCPSPSCPRSPLLRSAASLPVYGAHVLRCREHRWRLCFTQDQYITKGSEPCYLCLRLATPPTIWGQDRISNVLGYHRNSATCCALCNSKKGTSELQGLLNDLAIRGPNSPHQELMLRNMETAAFQVGGGS